MQFILTNIKPNKLDMNDQNGATWNDLKLGDDQENDHEERHHAEDENAVHFPVGSLITFSLLQLLVPFVNSRLC